MTDTERNNLNARLARAMGYKSVQIEWSNIHWVLLDPQGETVAGSLSLAPECPWDFIPDFTRDPAASRELVEWIKTQPIIFQEYFGTSLMRAIELEKELDYGEICGYQIPAILTAPLETIALAADAAIGGKDER